MAFTHFLTKVVEYYSIIEVIKIFSTFITHKEVLCKIKTHHIVLQQKIHLQFYLSIQKLGKVIRNFTETHKQLYVKQLHTNSYITNSLQLYVKQMIPLFPKENYFVNGHKLIKDIIIIILKIQHKIWRFLFFITGVNKTQLKIT